MEIEEKIRNYNPWICINCNHKYKNPKEEMELILVTPDSNEFRCKQCEAHIHVPVENKLLWDKAERTTG